MDVNNPIFISFVVQQDTHYYYYTEHIQLCMKPLNISKESYIRINEQGIMCIQHLVELNELGQWCGGKNQHIINAHDIFLDYLIIPLVDDTM